MSKNLCGKIRPADKPYEVWESGGWQWHVLKKYKSPEAEAKDPYARWFCLVKSSIMPEGEMGDCYVKDIVSVAHKTVDNVPKS